MENNRIQRIYLMLYLRIILITKSSEDIKTAYSNEIEELVDGIIFLLDYEPDYIYFDTFISEKIYDICSFVRQNYNNNRLIEKINQIIVKTNSKVCDHSYNTKRRKYFEKQQMLRCAYSSSINTNGECDEIQNEIAVCFKYDYMILDKLVQGQSLMLKENPGCILSSINYYLHECPELCDNRYLFYAFVEIASTIKQVITICYHEGLADKNAYISCCKVDKDITKKINNFCNDFGIPKSKIKEIRKEAKENIVYEN
ncbi:MAG: hypothetical protein IKO49_00065 [Bacilli bacterium]|nr:hypothetical protein [Bacilli bacterium]